MCVERHSNFLGCACQMSNFIHPFSGYLIFLLFTHRFFFSGMIAYDYGDVKYVYYGLDFYPSNANHTVGSFAKFLRNLEKPPVHSSRALFDGCGTTSLMRQCFKGKRFVYCHCWNHVVNPYLGNHCLQFSMFNLIIVLKQQMSIRVMFLVIACGKKHIQRGVCFFFYGGIHRVQH